MKRFNNSVFGTYGLLVANSHRAELQEFEQME